MTIHQATETTSTTQEAAQAEGPLKDTDKSDYQGGLRHDCTNTACSQGRCDSS